MKSVVVSPARNAGFRNVATRKSRLVTTPPRWSRSRARARRPAASDQNINENGYAEVIIDLKPDLRIDQIEKRLSSEYPKLSLTNLLRKTLKLSNVAIGLIVELRNKKQIKTFEIKKLAYIIKNYKLILEKPFAIERCISTAGGINFESIDENFMIKNNRKTYVIGEMLDWEAPTGGYLLQACISNGAFVAKQIIREYS